jgi:hypothetical protein
LRNEPNLSPPRSEPDCFDKFFKDANT